MRTTILIAMLSALAGCSAQRTDSFPASQPAAVPTQWVATLSPQRVSTFSPEHAKAILLARAAVEQRAKAAGAPAPQILDFRVTDTGEGWQVYVEYVGLWDEGKPYPAAGYFSTVYIDRSWTVRRIMGGA